MSILVRDLLDEMSSTYYVGYGRPKRTLVTTMVHLRESSTQHPGWSTRRGGVVWRSMGPYKALPADWRYASVDGPGSPESRETLELRPYGVEYIFPLP